jgi:hypothetical protein
MNLEIRKPEQTLRTARRSTKSRNGAVSRKSRSSRFWNLPRAALPRRVRPPVEMLVLTGNSWRLVQRVIRKIVVAVENNQTHPLPFHLGEQSARRAQAIEVGVRR